MLSLDFKWLDDFLCLNSMGSFSAAAKARNVTQSAFSRRIQGLEIWVGVPLFDRTSYPVKLTADGQKFVPYVEKMLSLIKETSDDFALASLKTDNSVRVICLHSFALNLVPIIFQKVQGLFDYLQLSLTPSVQGVENHFNALLDNTSDILFAYDIPSMRPTFLHEDKFERLFIHRSRIIPVIGRGFQLPSTEQSTIPYLAYAKHTFLYQPVNDILEKNRLALRQVFETTLSESLVKMAQMGVGLAWIPSHAIVDELESGELVHAFPEMDELELPIDIVCYRSRDNHRPAVEDFWQGTQIAIAEC